MFPTVNEVADRADQARIPEKLAERAAAYNKRIHDPNHIWFTGIAVQHSPSETELRIHWAMFAHKGSSDRN